MLKSYGSTVAPCPNPYLQEFGPSCTEFVYPRFWHFDNGATSKIDDVPLEHGGIPSCCPLVIFLGGQVDEIILRRFYSLSFCGPPPSCLKASCGVVAYRILFGCI